MTQNGGAEIQAALQALNAEVQRLREREQVLTNLVNQLQSTGSAASAGPGGSTAIVGPFVITLAYNPNLG